jgi:hypothetical protein
VNIPGADEVLKVFGRWPSFHDAEVVRFLLERSASTGAGPCIVADIRAFEMTREVGTDGKYVLKNQTLVSFHFSGVDQVELNGFNGQNVLWDLVVVDIRDRQMEDLRYEITFASSYGMGARFFCREVAVAGVRLWQPRGEHAG